MDNGVCQVVMAILVTIVLMAMGAKFYHDALQETGGIPCRPAAECCCCE